MELNSEHVILSNSEEVPSPTYYEVNQVIEKLNILTPNVNYSGRTAPLTSKVAFYIFIQQI